MTGQIEYWAKLGRAAETVMPSQVAAALKRCAGDLDALEDKTMRSKVLDALAVFQVQSPDLLRQKIGIDQQIVFEPDPENPRGIVRINQDGTTIRDVMDGRTFVPTAS